MPKKYEPITTERRRILLNLIHVKGYNISQAAKVTDIFYPTAKAINKVYKNTGRTDKKVHRNKKTLRFGADFPDSRAQNDTRR